MKVDQTVIRTTGDASVRFGAETHEYRFAACEKRKLKLDNHWVQVNMRRDQRGLDILFGRRSEEARSHYSYTARAETLYVWNHGSQLSRTLLFDPRDGAFVPLVDHIDDHESGLRLELRFGFDGSEIALDGCQLVPLPVRRPA